MVIPQGQAPAGLAAGQVVQLTNGMQAVVTAVDAADGSVTIDVSESERAQCDAVHDLHDLPFSQGLRGIAGMLCWRLPFEHGKTLPPTSPPPLRPRMHTPPPLAGQPPAGGPGADV